MVGPVQGGDEIDIQAPPRGVFDILRDSRRLPDWTSVVSTTGSVEAVGSVRNCEVNLDGRRGSVVERCIESSPPHRIAWAMERDTFGFSRLVSDFGFSFTLEAVGTDATRVRSESCYRPRGPLAAVVNALVLRRQFRRIRRQWLANLRRIAEESSSPSTSRPGDGASV